MAPLIIEDLFRHLADLNNDMGATMLLVEQNAELVSRDASRAMLEAADRLSFRPTNSTATARFGNVPGA